jgi:hypothetical protein
VAKSKMTLEKTVGCIHNLSVLQARTRSKSSINSKSRSCRYLLLIIPVATKSTKHWLRTSTFTSVLWILNWVTTRLALDTETSYLSNLQANLLPKLNTLPSNTSQRHTAWLGSPKTPRGYFKKQVESQLSPICSFLVLVYSWCCQKKLAL